MDQYWNLVRLIPSEDDYWRLKVRLHRTSPEVTVYVGAEKECRLLAAAYTVLGVPELQEDPQPQQETP